MYPNLPNILTFLFIFFANQVVSQEIIWSESFSVADKGVWGDEDSTTIHIDFENISKWTLDYENVKLVSPDDYAKTVATSKGRFECRDVNAEVVWRSELIDISAFKNVKIQLDAKETGSGKNETNKYLKVFSIVDEGEEILFDVKGENYGNWGASLSEQNNINGGMLQIVAYLSTHYAADKVILDEIVVSGEEKNPVVINPGDLLINEVLFNPFPEGEDFVEIYNNSEKEIPLQKLFLASRDKHNELTQIYPLSTQKVFSNPWSYLVLTKDTNGVFPYFNIKYQDCFLQLEKFPSFNNDEDVVVLLNKEMEIIDEFRYTDKMHAPLLADEEGISLERTSFEIATNNFTNWHSASTESGYGTPGYKNSQVLAENKTVPIVTFEPESFSPNSDGYNDEYQIHFQTPKPGFYVNIAIFDAAGRFVQTLAKNEILGTNEIYTWNGEDETGHLQNLGVYVVSVEIFDLFGNIYRFKDGVVLTSVLN